MTPRHIALGATLIAMVTILGYRVIATESARGAPAREETVAERLEHAPMDGDAFSDIAVAQRDSDNHLQVLALHEIAVRRDPRDLRIRVWLADWYMRAGQFTQALRHLDVILRLEPATRKVLLPAMVHWSDDPAFAKALAGWLRREPDWRNTMIGVLRQAVDSPGAGALLTELRESGHLEEREVGEWLDALIRAGHWGLAYSHWAAGLDLDPGEPLPMLYNGGFDSESAGWGFDWRFGHRAGTFTEFEPAPGARGNAARLVFLGRPVEAANLEQALHLPPGGYRLSMRVKSIDLHSDQGLHWAIVCAGQQRPLAAGERLEGNFGWRGSKLDFEVPGEGCEGQWLRLLNPAPRGSASAVRGELWFDDLRLRSMGMAG